MSDTKLLAMMMFGVVLSAAALMPRLGPGRASWIGSRSRFAFNPKPESLRLSSLLKNEILSKEVRHLFLVVIGEKGVGRPVYHQ